MPLAKNGKSAKLEITWAKTKGVESLVLLKGLSSHRTFNVCGSLRSPRAHFAPHRGGWGPVVESLDKLGTPYGVNSAKGQYPRFDFIERGVWGEAPG